MDSYRFKAAMSPKESITMQTPSEPGKLDSNTFSDSFKIDVVVESVYLEDQSRYQVTLRVERAHLRSLFTTDIEAEELALEDEVGPVIRYGATWNEAHFKARAALFEKMGAWMRRIAARPEP